MAVGYNPRIVTDGLVLALDAGNTKSFNNTSLDEYFSSVSLLLNGNGTNGSTTFTDSSNYGHTVTPNGNAQISTAQSKFGGASMYFDGSGDYLTISDDTSFHVGSGSFTIEFWIYLNSISANMTPINKRPSSSNGVEWLYLRITSSGALQLWATSNSSSWDIANGFLFGNSALSAGQWYHVALVRNGTEFATYVDGTKSPNTFTSSASIANGGTNALQIAGDSAYNQGYVNGYMDDLRITKGVARYTSNFTPPTAQHPAVPVWTDLSGKGNNVTLTGATYNSSNSGVFVFDGSNDYVREDTLLDTFTTTTDPWSVECWFNTDVKPDVVECMIGINYNNGAENTLLLGVVDNSGCKLNVYYRNSDISSNTTVTVGQWHHVVATHTSGSLKVYLDGTQIASDSNTVNRSLSDCAFLIGAELDSGSSFGNYFDGKISNVKMYNKTLTAAEVQQNYDANRGRYGI